ncbi:MAG: hypothetical protein U0871_29250 [Gemmataceae bacterium]
MRSLLLAAAFGLFAGPALADDKPVEIKFKPSKAGDKTRETVDEKTTTTVTAAVGGQEQTEKVESLEKLEYTEEVIEYPADPKDKKGAVKLKRSYTEADAVEGDEKEGLGLAGKTVVITGKDGKYEYALDGGGDVTEAAKKHFDEEFRDNSVSDDDILPGKPVKIGDTWAIDVKKLLGSLPDGMTADAAGSSAGGKLTKVYQKDGKTFGVFEVTMELVLTKFKQEDEETALKAGSKLTIETTYDGCIDGTSHEMTAKQVTKGELRPDVPEAELVIKIESTRNSSTTEVGK